MTKAELVEEVARAAELNKRDAEVIVETVFESIIGALHRGEKVELRGFGSFRTRERGPRRGRNPKTGEPVDVPAKRVPYFKPGKELKEYFTDEPEGAGETGKGDTGSESSVTPPAPAFPADYAGEGYTADEKKTEASTSGGGSAQGEASASQPATEHGVRIEDPEGEGSTGGSIL